jgi:hypothetical protein
MSTESTEGAYFTIRKSEWDKMTPATKEALSKLAKAVVDGFAIRPENQCAECHHNWKFFAARFEKKGHCYMFANIPPGRCGQRAQMDGEFEGYGK